MKIELEVPELTDEMKKIADRWGFEVKNPQEGEWYWNDIQGKWIKAEWSHTTQFKPLVAIPVPRIAPCKLHPDLTPVHEQLDNNSERIRCESLGCFKGPESSSVELAESLWNAVMEPAK